MGELKRLVPAIPAIISGLGVGRSKAYELLNSGELKAVKAPGGRRTLIDPDEIAAARSRLEAYQPGARYFDSDGAGGRGEQRLIKNTSLSQMRNLGPNRLVNVEYA